MNEDIKENEMYCPECGKLIDIDSINCKFCGENIDNVIKVVDLKPIPLKAVTKTGDSYVDACFQIEFQEFYEDRDWFGIPEAKVIPEAGNAGSIEEALCLAKALRDKYPDFYFSYYWFAILYCKQGHYEDARNSLIKGLHLVKSKYHLCEKMGDIERELVNLQEAVKWWIKSIVIQVSTEKIDNYNSFLYLSYVAEKFGLDGVC